MSREERATEVLAHFLNGNETPFDDVILNAMLAFANSELERAIQLTEVQSGAYAARHAVALIRAMMTEE